MGSAGGTSHYSDLPVAVSSIGAQCTHERLNVVSLLGRSPRLLPGVGAIVAMLARHQTARRQIIVDGDNIVAGSCKTLCDRIGISLIRTALLKAVAVYNNNAWRGGGRRGCRRVDSPNEHTAAIYRLNSAGIGVIGCAVAVAYGVAVAHVPQLDGVEVGDGSGVGVTEQFGVGVCAWVLPSVRKARRGTSKGHGKQSESLERLSRHWFHNFWCLGRARTKAVPAGVGADACEKESRFIEHIGVAPPS